MSTKFVRKNGGIGRRHINTIINTPQKLITSAEKARIIIKERDIHIQSSLPLFAVMRFVNFGYVHDIPTKWSILRRYVCEHYQLPNGNIVTDNYAISIVWQLYDSSNNLVDIDTSGSTSYIQIFPITMSLYKWIAWSFGGYGYISTKHTYRTQNNIKIKSTEFKKFLQYVNTLKEYAEPFYHSNFDKLAFIPNMSNAFKNNCFLLTSFSALEMEELFSMMSMYKHRQITDMAVIIKLRSEENENVEE